MADQTQRLEIATVRAEVGSNIVFRFANDAANADSIPTQSGDIQNLKQIVLEIQQDAAEKISISTTIYPTVAKGLLETADQGIFLVQSNDADEIYTVWQNQGGIAVNTGKTALSATAIQTALDASNEAAQAAEEAADMATARTSGFLAPSDIDPVVRDNGLPLQVGDRYFNTAQKAERIYTDAGWQANDSQLAIADLEAQISQAPAPNGIPRADSSGKVDRDWLPENLGSYAELRTYTGSASTIKVVDAFRTGRFRKIATSSAGYVDDGGITIISLKGWVWQRINVGDAHVEWFLPADWVEGSSDDRIPFEKAMQYQRSKGGGRVRFFHRHLLNTATFINDLVELVGPVPSVGRIQNGEKDYQKRQGVLIVNPAVSIFMESSASLKNAILVRKGMGSFPFADNAEAVSEIAAFAGTAVVAAAADPQVENCLFLGFNKAFYSNGQPRVKIKNVMGDCTNGIHVNGSFDVLDISNCHFWPFLCYSTGVQFDPSTSYRSGSAYRISNSDDWGRLNKCFSFGYERGTLIENADSISVINGSADYFGAPVNTSMIGFEITGTSKATSLIGCQAASQWRGVSINTTAVDRPTVQIIAGQFWNNDGEDIHLTKGHAIISGNFFSRAPISINIEPSALGAIITGNRFDKCIVRPVDGSMTNVTAGENQFIDCVDTILGERKVSVGASTLNRVDTSFGGPVISHLNRRSGGTSDAPTALGDSAVLASYVGQAYNGTAFTTIAGIRFQTTGPQTSTSAPGGIVFSVTASGATAGSDVWLLDQDKSLKPTADAVSNIGSAARRINNSFFAVAPTVGSDERYKTDTKKIPDIVLDAWATVDYQQYKLLQAIDQKGEEHARIHIGVIAQRVVEAFANFGLDAHDYGLLCHDKWDEKIANEGVTAEDGTIISQASITVESVDRYSIRYEEALALESALMRRAIARLEQKISSI